MSEQSTATYTVATDVDHLSSADRNWARVTDSVMSSEAKPRLLCTAVSRQPGLMSPPTPPAFQPGLMSMPSRPDRPTTSDPNGPSFEWSRDGVAYLWLLVLVLAFVLWIGLLAHS